MAAKKKLSAIDAFQHLGINIEAFSDHEARGDCPLCDKENHLYLRYAGMEEKRGKVSVPGHWSCKSCQEAGTLQTMFRLMQQANIKFTTEEDYKYLWSAKRISPAAAKFCGVFKNSLNGNWYIPTFGTKKDSVVNLHKWSEANNKLYGAPTCETHLLGRHLIPHDQKGVPLPDPNKELWLPEGHWDFIVGTHLIRSLKLSETIDILGVPGAGSFKHEWLPYLYNRVRVTILFDNDHPKVNEKSGKVTQAGLDGTKRLVNMVAGLDETQIPQEMRYLKWPDGLADGFDLRDLFISNRSKTNKQKVKK